VRALTHQVERNCGGPTNKNQPSVVAIPFKFQIVYSNSPVSSNDMCSYSTPKVQLGARSRSRFHMWNPHPVR